MKKITIGSALIAAAFMLSSCFITMESAVNKKSIMPKDFGSPKEKTLIFGIMDVYGANPYPAEYMQINPENEAKFAKASTLPSNVFYLPPSDKGDTFALISIRASAYNIVYTGKYGLQTANKPVFKAEKPGLQYVGHYTYKGNGFVYKEESAKMELKALKVIEKKFRKTEWAKLIQKRIKKLEEENE